jgi:hypothetical protein
MNRIAQCVSGTPLLLIVFGGVATAQLTDRNVSPNSANAGIAKTLAAEIGPVASGADAQNRGDINTDGTSLYIISRDPFRSIRRGRQIFQRKFTKAEGQGPAFQDAAGSLNENTGEPHKGSGLSDSCASCHGRPKGSAGASGDTFTRPDSRDSPHLFGLGLKEMLADEITQDLRSIQAGAAGQAAASHNPVTLSLDSKGINFGKITVSPSGAVDTSQVQGVNPDLRVRQIFADGELFSIREAIIATFKFELGLEASDPVMAAVNGLNCTTTVCTSTAPTAQTTPSGMVLDPAKDKFPGPPPAPEQADNDGDGHTHEFPASLVDHMEFYLLNYFTPGTYQTDAQTFKTGLIQFNRIGCGSCHIQNLLINHDRRVGTVDVSYDSVNGGFNNMFATVTPIFKAIVDNPALPSLKLPQGGQFLVQNIFTDFKRHDLGPNFHENMFDNAPGGTNFTTMFLTAPLWGVASTAPYGHDGRSINLNEVILRHGGEAQAARDAYANMGAGAQQQLLAMLNSLVLFPPDDTASNLQPEAPNTVGYPQNGHGAIKLGALFNFPTCPSPATTVTCGPE